MPYITTEQQRADMSRALLRSVSVMYTGYLRNMGVGSTMVMPLTKDGKLWGLISAMNHSGRLHVPYETRMAVELIARVMCLQMAAKEDQEAHDYRLRMAGTLAGLIQGFTSTLNLNTALVRQNGQPNLLSFLDAVGAAIVTETNGASTIGLVPNENELRELVAWLAVQNEPIVATDRLSERWPPAACYADRVSGLIAARLSLWAEPNPGGGTVFRFTLPSVQFGDELSEAGSQ